MESERKQKPYPYKAAEFTAEELEKMKSASSLREYNVFHDCNHIIYSLVVQLIKERSKNEKL